MNSYQCFQFILRTVVLSLDFFIVMPVLYSTPSHNFWAFPVERARGEEGMHVHIVYAGRRNAYTYATAFFFSVENLKSLY